MCFGAERGSQYPRSTKPVLSFSVHLPPWSSFKGSGETSPKIRAVVVAMAGMILPAMNNNIIYVEIGAFIFLKV